MAPALAVKLNQIFRDGIADAEVSKSFLTQNATAEGMPVEEFAALFKAEDKRFMSLVEDVGASIQR